MSWKLQVRHETRYDYETPVLSSYNEARISPLDMPTQFTLEHRVEVSPPANLFRYRDYWGTRVHAFDLHRSHSEFSVVGTSLVETARRAPIADESVTWEALTATGLADRFCEYLTATPITAPDDAVLAVAAQLRNEQTPAAAVAAMGEWLGSNVEYQPGWTNVSTTATEVLRAGRGVCQDYVHLSLAFARACGIPARYASGYLFSSATETVGEAFEGQSHAWLEVWLGDWHPIDPTSGDEVAEKHVLVARGRDYGDVPPLKGVFQGGSSAKLSVSVELTRVA
jgi:transglutaminase-like putative cysteine protease